MSEWISVEDRLPCYGKYVLWLNENRDDGYRCFVAFIESEGRFLVGPRDFDIHIFLEDATHWMELPELPKTEVCLYCDPDKFVVYGKCKKCGKEVRPPLMDIDVPIGFCTEKGSKMLKRLLKN